MSIRRSRGKYKSRNKSNKKSFSRGIKSNITPKIVRIRKELTIEFSESEQQVLDNFEKYRHNLVSRGKIEKDEHITLEDEPLNDVEKAYYYRGVKIGVQEAVRRLRRIDQDYDDNYEQSDLNKLRYKYELMDSSLVIGLGNPDLIGAIFVEKGKKESVDMLEEPEKWL